MEKVDFEEWRSLPTTRWFLEQVMAAEIATIQSKVLPHLGTQRAEDIALQYVDLTAFMRGIQHVIEFDPFREAP